MKRILLIVLILIFSSGTSTVLANRIDRKAATENSAVVSKEDKLSKEEMDRITKRVEEIRKMDKSNLTVNEKRELRNELRTYQREYRGHWHHRGGVVFIGGGTLLLIIILIIVLAG